MKKFKLLNNAAVVLLIVSISLFLFTGCQNKNNVSQTNASNSNIAGNPSNNRRPNASEMKKNMQDKINSLVKDRTINQSQADKILEALTANTQRFNGGKRPQNNQQNTQQNGLNNRQDNKQNRQRNNPLRKLVSDGVITQAQADAVMQNIRGNFNRPSNNS